MTAPNPVVKVGEQVAEPVMAHYGLKKQALEQAREVGAEVLATSCPYCITQFEDSRLTQKDSESTQIKDITEILQEVI